MAHEAKEYRIPSRGLAGHIGVNWQCAPRNVPMPQTGARSIARKTGTSLRGSGGKNQKSRAVNHPF